MLGRTGLAVAALAATLLWNQATPAQMLEHRGPPQHRLVHRHMIAARLNPQGILYDGRITYRYRLYESERLALRDNFIGVGVAPGATPAYLRGGPIIEIQPLTVLGFWALFEYVGHFGAFGTLQSFPTATADFSDSELERRRELPKADPLRNYSAGGTQLTIGSSLLFKAGPMVLRNSARLVRPDMALRGGDRVFYDSMNDTLAPDRGFYFTDDLDVAYRTESGRLLAGVRYTAILDFYGARHFLPGEPNRVENDSHRVGPVIAYTFFANDGAAFNTPTVFVLAQWWLAHRWRTGQDVSAAIPMFVAGFQFTGDLVPID